MQRDVSLPRPNFAKAFGVQFQTRGGLDHVWFDSWGVSTRLIAADHAALGRPRPYRAP